MHNSRDFPVAFGASGIALRSVLVGLLIAVIASSAAGQIKISYRHSFEPYSSCLDKQSRFHSALSTYSE